MLHQSHDRLKNVPWLKTRIDLHRVDTTISPQNQNQVHLLHFSTTWKKSSSSSKNSCCDKEIRHYREVT